MSIKAILRDKILPSWIHVLYQKAYFQYIKSHPQYQAGRIYQDYLGRKLNWDNPQEYTEKGRWLQFHSDTSRWPELADKYMVRKFIEDNGFGEYLPKLYGVWEHAADIDFAKLPKSFVLKTNHGSGEVIVVKDKSTINEVEVRHRMENYLKEKYGYMTAEPHYLKIEPRIVAEELLENTCPDSKTIVDYKVFCFLGEPFLLDVCYNRDAKTHHCQENWYDLGWKVKQNYFSGDYTPKVFVRPQSLDKMLDICRVLTKNFPLVRLDFYDVGGHPYIGEMTFTPSGFNGDSLTDEARMEVGKHLDLTKIPKKMLVSSLPKHYQL